MKKTKYVKLRGEKFLTTLTIIFIVGFVLVSFVGKAMIQSSNSELQRLKSKINSQKEMNASIQMKINELASLENLESVAKKMGLSYTSNSIKTINE